MLVTHGPFSFVLTGETPVFFTGGLAGNRQRFSGGGVSTGTRPNNRLVYEVYIMRFILRGLYYDEMRDGVIIFIVIP